MRQKRKETKVVLAKTYSESLRTTIPAHIVEVLGLEEGDSLHWEFKMENSDVVVLLRKATHQKDETKANIKGV